jgi:hypothetical protein
MPTPFQQSAAVLDLSPRLFKTAAVVASPAAATETIIASLTSAVGGQLKIRRTDVSGATVKDSGAVTVVATKLYAPDIVAFDVFQAAPGAVYVLTLTMASGAAESTVSAVSLVALAV